MVSQLQYFQSQKWVWASAHKLGVGGTPNALLASAKAEKGQVQNWNTQFIPKSLRIFDFCFNLDQNWNSTLKNGIL